MHAPVLRKYSLDWGPTIWGPIVSRATDFRSREPLTGLGAYSLGAYSLGAYSLGAYNLGACFLGAYSLLGDRFWVSGSKHLFLRRNIEDLKT